MTFGRSQAGPAMAGRTSPAKSGQAGIVSRPPAYKVDFGWLMVRSSFLDLKFLSDDGYS